MKTRLAVLFLALVATPSSAEVRAVLPKCHEEATSSPDGWQHVVAPGRDFEFLLPPSMRHSPDQPRFRHGGELWDGAGYDVTVSYGIWSSSSFGSDPSAKKCETEINGIPVLLVTTIGNGRCQFSAWLQTKRDMYEPLLDIKVLECTDLALPRQILGSIHRTKAR